MPTKVIVEITYADDLRTPEGGPEVLRILEDVHRKDEGVSHVNAYFAETAPTPVPEAARGLLSGQVVVDPSINQVVGVGRDPQPGTGERVARAREV